MKILVCDDHALFREGVMTALRGLADELELHEAANGSEALEIARQQPDLELVLLDLQMPGMDGWTGLERLQAMCPTLPIVILSASEDPRDARRAIDEGASGFIPKSTRGPVLRAALSLVLSGGIYLPPNVLSRDGVEFDASEDRTPPRSGPSRGRIDSLTAKQLEVLQLMARGLTNAEIGAVMGTSMGTVKTHLSAIFRALDVSNRTEAALVMRNLDLDPDT